MYNYIQGYKVQELRNPYVTVIIYIYKIKIKTIKNQQFITITLMYDEVILNYFTTTLFIPLRRCSESIPVEQLVAQLCDIKQAYTQFGGKRPFGVSFLYMGHDQHYGYQVRMIRCGWILKP